MPLEIKDGGGNTTYVQTTLTGSNHMPHHIIQEISGTNVTTIVNKLTDISSSVAAVQTVTASSANPVYVTGAVTVSQPVSVDVVVGDNIFVTSSLSAPLYVSSSTNSPILVTGTVALQSNAVTASISGTPSVTSSFANPLAVTGTVALQSNAVTASISGTPTVTLSSNAVTASISGTPTVTLSSNAVTASITGTSTITGTVALQSNAVTASISGPATITASVDNPVAITGTVNLVSNQITASISGVPTITGTVALQSNAVTASIFGTPTITGTVAITGIPTVTASFSNPVAITGSFPTVNDGLKVELSGSNVKQISGSSTNTYLQVHQASVGTGSVKTRIHFKDPSPAPDQYFDWTTSQSGTIIAVSSSSSRKSLSIFNPSIYNIYVAVGTDQFTATSGFSLQTTSSAPNFYSFILYPSGTYFANPADVGLGHGLYAISQSYEGYDESIKITEIY